MNKKYETGIAFGTWDYLHYGHIKFLQHAKQYCEHLIVAVDTDEYAKDKKGKDTYQDYFIRTTALNELRCVDEVIYQKRGFSKRKAILEHEPEVIFVGTDHKDNGWEGARLASEYCLDVLYIPEANIHSSDIIKIIKKNEKSK